MGMYDEIRTHAIISTRNIKGYYASIFALSNIVI